jgi:alpha-beta hydrolase superfamily lysophospholipase
MTRPSSIEAWPRQATTPTETPSSFAGVGGLELFARRWAPDDTPRAAVCVVHGFGEHSGRYAGVVGPLTAAGYAVHGFDLRGHGRSEGRRGHIAAWSEYRDDVGLYLDHVQTQEAPGTRLFLYGHSLGGAIVLESGLRRGAGLPGVIASSPALRPAGVRSPVLESLASAVSRVWPTASLGMPLEDEALSRDPALVAATRADTLSHRRISARSTVESIHALAWTEAHAGMWRLPLLLFHGTADRIADPAGTIAFAETARAGGATDVELHLYEGSYHETHNDLDAPSVAADVVTWLDRHIMDALS